MALWTQKPQFFYEVFATPDPKSDGLAEAFKRKVQPNRGFGGVGAPKPRNLRGFYYRESTKPTLRGDATREDKRRQDKRREGKR